MHKKWILHHVKLCILYLHLLAGQHSKSLHNNTASLFHYRRDLMISAIWCGEKIYIYIVFLVLIIGQMWLIGYQQKIKYWASVVIKHKCCHTLPNGHWINDHWGNCWCVWIPQSSYNTTLYTMSLFYEHRHDLIKLSHLAGTSTSDTVQKRWLYRL